MDDELRAGDGSVVWRLSDGSGSDATQELRALYKTEKWREDAQFSVITPFASVLELKKGQDKLTVLVVPGDDDKSSEVTLSGSGLAKKKGE